MKASHITLQLYHNLNIMFQIKYYYMFSSIFEILKIYLGNNLETNIIYMYLCHIYIYIYIYIFEPYIYTLYYLKHIQHILITSYYILLLELLIACLLV